MIILGDVHGRWNKTNLIVNANAHPDEIVICSGDLCNYNFEPKHNQRMVFTPGNHENYYVIAELLKNRTDFSPLFPLITGELYVLPNGLIMLGISGVFSPFLFAQEGKRNLKYWHRQDFEKIDSIDSRVDVILSHESPSSIGFEKNGQELGSERITELIRRFKPRLLFFGHHHKYFEGRYKDTLVYGLEQPHKSFLLMNETDFSIRRVAAMLNRGTYTYDWEVTRNGKCGARGRI